MLDGFPPRQDGQPHRHCKYNHHHGIGSHQLYYRAGDLYVRRQCDVVVKLMAKYIEMVVLFAENADPFYIDFYPTVC